MDILKTQDALDRAKKLNAITEVGLAPGHYTLSDIADLEQLVGIMDKAARFSRIDIATRQTDAIIARWRQGKISNTERAYFTQVNYERLGQIFGVKPGTIESEVSTMRGWPHERRIPGAHVSHYRAIPSGMPQEQAREMLMDAVEQGWSAKKLAEACYATLEQTALVAQSKPPDEWDRASEFIDRHDITGIRRVSPTRLVLSAASGAMILESDTPIRVNTTGTQPEQGEHT